ncbi:hypothetical protein V1477_017114 [Vespula maculifrons]|uniref:Uncharacterized protein n=1 Tax=Vespula maculifrons TaxID=7453 RepID=A0ABD2B553_VESMC
MLEKADKIGILYLLLLSNDLIKNKNIVRSTALGENSSSTYPDSLLMKPMTEIHSLQRDLEKLIEVDEQQENRHQISYVRSLGYCMSFNSIIVRIQLTTGTDACACAIHDNFSIATSLYSKRRCGGSNTIYDIVVMYIPNGFTYQRNIREQRGLEDRKHNYGNTRNNNSSGILLHLV